MFGLGSNLRDLPVCELVKWRRRAAWLLLLSGANCAVCAACWRANWAFAAFGIGLWLALVASVAYARYTYHVVRSRSDRTRAASHAQSPR
jgi:type IV secretory pathway TrbD component